MYLSPSRQGKLQRDTMDVPSRQDCVYTKCYRCTHIGAHRGIRFTFFSPETVSFFVCLFVCVLTALAVLVNANCASLELLVILPLQLYTFQDCKHVSGLELSVQEIKIYNFQHKPRYFHLRKIRIPQARFSRQNSGSVFHVYL